MRSSGFIKNCFLSPNPYALLTLRFKFPEQHQGNLINIFDCYFCPCGKLPKLFLIRNLLYRVRDLRPFETSVLI